MCFPSPPLSELSIFTAHSLRKLNVLKFPKIKLKIKNLTQVPTFYYFFYVIPYKIEIPSMSVLTSILHELIYKFSLSVFLFVCLFLTNPRQNV